MEVVKKGVFLLVVAMFLLIPTSVFADTNNPIVKEKTVYVGRVQLEDAKFPLDNYKIETQVGDGILASGDRALASMNDGLWSLNKQIASFTIYAVEQLMTFDLISQIADQAAIISKNIYNGMSTAFSSLFLVIAGGTAYFYFANQQTARAVKALVGAIVISVATYWSFSNTSANIKWINQLSSNIEGIAISTNVMLSSQSLNNERPKDYQESSAILRNQLFDLMVKKPYLLLNYGTTKESDILKNDPERINKLLSLQPYGDAAKSKRSDIVTDEVSNKNNVTMTTDYSMERFAEIFLTIILTVVISVPVVAMAGMKFLLQLFLLVALMFTAIPLIMSLIPQFADTATQHFKRIAGLILHKAALALIISVSVGVSTLVYETTNLTSGLDGYMLMVFLTALVMWGIFKYRTEILEVVSMGYVTSNNVAHRITQSATQTIKESAGKGYEITKRITEPIRSRYRDSGESQNLEQPKRFTVVKGGNQGIRSTARQMPSSDRQSVQDGSRRLVANSGDSQTGQLSPSRNVMGTASGQNGTQNSTESDSGVKINELKPQSTSTARMVSSEQMTPASIQQENKTSRMTASEHRKQEPVSPARSARFEQPMSGDFETLVAHMPPEVAPNRMTTSEHGKQVPVSPARSARYEQSMSGNFESLIAHIPTEVAATQEQQVPSISLPKQEQSKNRQNPQTQQPKRIETKRMRIK